jgi:hypothetical protein
MAAYTIDVRPRARRSLRQLDPSAQKAIAQAIDGLATDPRPPGFLPLTGHRPYLRIRSGDYPGHCPSPAGCRHARRPRRAGTPILLALQSCAGQDHRQSAMADGLRVARDGATRHS